MSSHEFSTKENKLAKVAKALAHPARITILNLLAKRQSCVCGDIVDELPLSQSTVSQQPGSKDDPDTLGISRAPGEVSKRRNPGHYSLFWIGTRDVQETCQKETGRT